MTVVKYIIDALQHRINIDILLIEITNTNNLLRRIKPRQS